MKKTILALALCLAGAAMVFGQVGPQGTKEAAPEDNSDIKTLQLAYDLADYGYETESPTALLQAAEMLAQIKTKKADYEAIQEGTSGEASPSAARDYSASSLVASARELAGKDKNLLAWAKNVEKSIKASTRGASGGALYNASFAYANGGVTWYDWYFDGGRLAEVAVRSLDGADLDLYVYDQNGNMITYDERYGTDAYCSWTPRWTGIFRICIKNNARYNATYEIFTN